MKKKAKKAKKTIKKLDHIQRLMKKWGKTLGWNKKIVKAIVTDYPIKKFELAPQDKVDDLQLYVDQVLKALGHPDALATDESYISDFLPFIGSMGRKEAFEKFSKKMKKLGIEVKFEDSIIEVAERLRNKSK